jgi:hypothetical protein
MQAILCVAIQAVVIVVVIIVAIMAEEVMDEAGAMVVIGVDMDITIITAVTMAVYTFRD